MRKTEEGDGVGRGGDGGGSEESSVLLRRLNIPLPENMYIF